MRLIKFTHCMLYSTAWVPMRNVCSELSCHNVVSHGEVSLSSNKSKLVTQYKPIIAGVLEGLRCNGQDGQVQCTSTRLLSVQHAACRRVTGATLDGSYFAGVAHGAHSAITKSWLRYQAFPIAVDPATTRGRKRSLVERQVLPLSPVEYQLTHAGGDLDRLSERLGCGRVAQLSPLVPRRTGNTRC